jgi:hypothetical protein
MIAQRANARLTRVSKPNPPCIQCQDENSQHSRTRALSRILRTLRPQQQVENGQTIANTYPGGCAGAGGHALSREDPTTAIVSKETAFVTVSTAMAGVAFHQAVENGWESQVSTRLYRMI